MDADKEKRAIISFKKYTINITIYRDARKSHE